MSVLMNCKDETTPMERLFHLAPETAFCLRFKSNSVLSDCLLMIKVMYNLIDNQINGYLQLRYTE